MTTMTLTPGQKAPQLNEDQDRAIRMWASCFGRNWKSHLRHAWETGDYQGFEDSHLLQQVRNNLGPSWLFRYRVPGFPAGRE